MRCSRYYWAILSLVIVGVASATMAQQPDGTQRTTGSPTLFDILQSRLKASGLAPSNVLHNQPQPTSQPYAPNTKRTTRATPTLASPTRSNPTRSAPNAPRANINGPRVLVETDLDVPGTAPLPVGVGDPQAHSQKSATNRMHQRLSAFRNSQFRETDRSSSDESIDRTPDLTPSASKRQTPHLAEQRSLSDERVPVSTDRPTLASPRSQGHVADEPRLADMAPANVKSHAEPTFAEPAPKYASERASRDPIVAEKSVPSRQPTVDEPIVREPVPSSRAIRSQGGSSQVLFSQQSPVLNVKTVGPERIDVGREATFRVTIENLGAAAAEELIVAIDFPQWADLLGAEVSTGATSSEVAGDGTQLFRWKIGRLRAKDVQTVALHVVARQSQPLNLAVNWQHAPVATATKISVLQPDLRLKLDGPEEVLFGKKQVYRLELENAGTGDARNVSLALLPLGTGQERPAIQPIGDLPAGQQKAIEVELTARNEGDLVIQVDASADGNVRAHLSEKVRVLRPALEVAVTAPEFQFVGQEVAYEIVVKNPGTAAATSVNVEALLPETMAYESSTKDGLIADLEGRVRWGFDELGPQESRTLLVKCVAKAAGQGRLEVKSQGADNLSAAGEASVQIDAIADLALEVTDPAGPVAVGKETLYQLKVENRGSKAADGVEIVAYFSHGIEPLGAEGGNHRVGPGQVVFDPIPTIAAGEAKTLVVKARAESTGNHIIRAEVFCKPLGTRLVGEESTYFYGKRKTKPLDATPPRPSIAEEGVLTADQRGAAPNETREQPQE